MTRYFTNLFKTPWQRLGARRALILGLCAIVGVLSGCAAVLMHNLAHIIDHWCTGFLADKGTMGRYIAPALPAVGIFFCIIFAKLFIRRKRYNRSLFTAIQEARLPGKGVSTYHCYSHIVTCGVGVGMGISAGMEAPSALTGAAIGANIARWLHLPRETMSLLLSAGSAAGISSVFMAPLGGTLFACEVLLPRVNNVLFVPLLLAAATGAIVSRCMSSGPAFAAATRYVWYTGNILLYIVLGIICGLFSWGFIRLNCVLTRYSSRISNIWLKGLLGSILLYIFFYMLPVVSGQGYRYISEILHGNLSALPLGVWPNGTADSAWLLLTMVLAAALFNPMISMISLNAGGDGGLFGPSLVTGGFVGFACHLVLGLFGITCFPVINCVTAGMAGVLAGVMHAPLTGLFLIAEMLGGYELFIPLMIVVAISSFISKALARRNLYFATAAATAPEEHARVESVSEDALSELGNTQVYLLADKHYITLSPTDTFRQFLKLLVHTDQHFFPVINHDGRLVGMVDEKAIRPHILNKNLYDMLIVDDFMEPPAKSIDGEAPISEATALFDASGKEYLTVKNHATGIYDGILERSHLVENYRSHLGNNLF